MAKKYALIIGIDAYQDSSFTPLKKAKADADGIESLLKSGALGEFASVTKLVDENNITVGSGVKNFFRNSELEKDDLLLFYFAGHGCRDTEDGKLYFAMIDSIETSLETSALDCAHLKNLMEKSTSEKQLIILDSCFSGGFGEARSVDGFELANGLGNQKGRYVISATGKYGLAYEQLGGDNTFKSSIFTHALIEGIQSGKAANDRGAVTFTSIFSYVSAKVKQATSAKQIPKQFIYEGDDDLVLVVSKHKPLPDNLLQELNSTNHDECLVAMIKLKHDHLHDENYHKAAGSVLEDKLNHRDYYVRSEANELYLRIKNHKQNSQLKALVPKRSNNQYSHSHPKNTNNVQALELVLSKYQPGDVFQDPLKIGGLGPRMVVIPGGEFLMGSPSDDPNKLGIALPQHKVKLNTFAMGETVITFKDYKTYCNATDKKRPGDYGWGKENLPVVNIDWDDASDYMQWLSEQTGKIYHLPSEAQWEYACRAKTITAFSTGDSITVKQANYGNNIGKTQAIKSYPPNQFGLFDMHGNVWDWCADVWHERYDGAPSDGSAWMSEGDQSRRVLRGGSWFSNVGDCRSAFRFALVRDYRNRNIGVRPMRFLD